MQKLENLLVSMFLVFYLISPIQATIVFTDNFDRSDGPLGGEWTVISGKWAVKNGKCIQTDTSLSRSHSIVGDLNWMDVVIKVKAKLIEGSGVIVLFRYVDANNWYEAFIRQDIDVAVISKYEAGKTNWIKWTPLTSELNVWYELKVEVFRTLIRFYVDNVLVLETIDSTFTKGRIGLGTLMSYAYFDDVKVTNTLTNIFQEPITLEFFIISIAVLTSYAAFRYRSFRRNQQVNRVLKKYP